MSRRFTNRIVIAFMAVTAGVLISASSALAAGAPTATTLGKLAPSTTLNELGFRAEINPNGAATKYHFEYGTTESLGSSTADQNAGAGSETVQVGPELVRGFNSNTTYYVRVKATNEYGSTAGSIKTYSTSKWVGFKDAPPATFPSTYASSGTFTIEMPTYFKLKITCKETGSGTIGNKGGAGDSINAELTGCSVEPGTNCKIKTPLVTKLDSNFNAIGGSGGVLWLLDFNYGECGFPDMEIKLAEAFKLNAAVFPPPPGTYPMTFNATTKWGAHTVYLSGSSTWWLTAAANIGKSFWPSPLA